MSCSDIIVLRIYLIWLVFWKSKFFQSHHVVWQQKILQETHMGNIINVIIFFTRTKLFIKYVHATRANRSIQHIHNINLWTNWLKIGKSFIDVFAREISFGHERVSPHFYLIPFASCRFGEVLIASL